MSGYIDVVPKKIYRWKQMPSGMTPGGTPVYVCGNCGKSDHLHGVEYPKRKVFCEECGCINMYPWDDIDE